MAVWHGYEGRFSVYSIAFFVFCGAIAVLSMAIRRHLSQKKTRSSSAILVDSMLTSIGCVGTFSFISRKVYSVGSDSRRDKKSTAEFILPGLCARVKLNCTTKSHAIHDGGGVILACKNLVTGLLSVIIMKGFVDPQKNRPNSLNSKYMAKSTLA